MSTGADTIVRGHIDAELRRVDRKGGNQTVNIEKMTEVEHVASSNPPKISLFPAEFFNNISRLLSVERAFSTDHRDPELGKV
jgi:hypothetical protein